MLVCRMSKSFKLGSLVHIVTLKEYIENNLEFETPLYLIRKPIGYDEVDRIYEITNSGIYNHDNPEM